MKLFSKLTGLLFLASIILFLYARLIEPVLLTVKYENIHSNFVNDKSDNIKIIQFSDTHISEFFDMDNLKKTVNKINN